MAKVLNETITGVEQLAPDIFKMCIHSEHIAQNASPGQFLNIKCGEGTTPLLRRPISICDIDRKTNTVDTVFQVKGEGTSILSKKKAGENIDILGPLGKTFDIDSKYKNIAVLGGGIGIFPLLFLLKESKASVKNSYLGFRSKDLIVLENEFKEATDNLFISTDDGSYGYSGLITEVFEKEIENAKPDILYTCGPAPMVKQVSMLAEAKDIPCQVSLEERMGCGIGACLVCACATKKGDAQQYSHVCIDGPVFWSKDVIF